MYGVVIAPPLTNLLSFKLEDPDSDFKHSWISQLS